MMPTASNEEEQRGQALLVSKIGKPSHYLYKAGLVRHDDGTALNQELACGAEVEAKQLGSCYCLRLFLKG